MKQINIGTETIREIVPGEQYTVRPGDNEYYEDDILDPYEIVICNNGEEWTVYARSFPKGGEESYNEDIMSDKQYFDMLPTIKAAFNF